MTKNKEHKSGSLKIKAFAWSTADRLTNRPSMRMEATKKTRNVGFSVVDHYSNEDGSIGVDIWNQK